MIFGEWLYHVTCTFTGHYQKMSTFLLPGHFCVSFLNKTLQFLLFLFYSPKHLKQKTEINHTAGSRFKGHPISVDIFILVLEVTDMLQY